MNITIGIDALDQLEKYLESCGSSSIFILTDSNCEKNCLPILHDKAPSTRNAKLISVTPGEKNKSWISLGQILDRLTNLGADRNSVLINLGGGMITDLGGFSASVYMRGIRFVHIPTSLMGMVDASIGGKNAINFSGIKNLVGAFRMPEHIFIYPSFLETLPQRELRSAFPEIIKHVLLSDKEEWRKLAADPTGYFSDSRLTLLIQKSVDFKQSVVSDDFMETGRRHILNFGHTFGHAIESLSHENGSELLHGEAVAIGITGELFLSRKLLGLDENVLNDVIRVFKSLLSLNINKINVNAMNRFLTADKKNNSSSVGYSLLHSPGVPSSILFPDKLEIEEGIQFMQEIFSKEVALNP